MSDERIEYYELTKRVIEPVKPGEVRIVTQALITCGLCGTCIDTVGGPGSGAVCKPCGSALKSGQLRGAVVWKEEGET